MEKTVKSMNICAVLCKMRENSAIKTKITIFSEFVSFYAELRRKRTLEPKKGVVFSKLVLKPDKVITKYFLDRLQQMGDNMMNIICRSMPIFG